MRRLILAAMAILGAAAPGTAQRKPVLPQIDLPHPYYYREMYLPQLTNGPSSVAWSPDSQEVVYSMGGSLWRQRLDSRNAQQITDGPGYDYQPDWSPDGKWIVYCTYHKDAIELGILDLQSGKRHVLTETGAVNVEPRWSPDGRRLVFVSTSYNKRFHIFAGDVKEGRLENIVRLTGETKSPLPRYYYSAFDTEISPAWTPDGKEIVFVSNRDHIYGTGGFWRMKAEPGAEAKEIHYEETNWKARPDCSPDGSRIVYSSYLGGQWHNLWVMPADGGGDAFPLTYGERDATNVRWSPDGKHLAYVSNQNGSTSVEIMEIPGGGVQQLAQVEAKDLKYVRLHGRVRIQIEDENGHATSARISLTDLNGRFGMQESARVHADDGYDRNERPFEAHYVHVHGAAEFVLPPGQATLEVMKGFEYKTQTQKVDVKADGLSEIRVRLQRLAPPWDKGQRWASGDLHVHMNYGGVYRNSPNDLRVPAEAEYLQVVNNLVVNKEQRIPDVAYAGKGVDPSSSADYLMIHGQEFHTSYWGHRGLLNMKDGILLPGYAGYPHTAAASLYPMNADVADMAHAQGALVGAVHPFDEIPDPYANPPQRITDELPVDVALGKLDYMEIVGFSDHKSTAAVWYRLLNLGYRIPASAGTDAMANFSSLRGPIGMNRVYARVAEGPLKAKGFLDALKTGKTFATNGPLLSLVMGGKQIGDEMSLHEAQSAVPFTAKMSAIVPVDHLEVVCNGRVIRDLPLSEPRDSANVTATLALNESGWCILRAWSDKAEHPVLDNYVYATTSPIYLTIGGKQPRSPEDAKYFVAWIDRVIEATSNYPDWNSAAEKTGVLKKLELGRSVFQKMR